jgi:hypothetical protein
MITKMKILARLQLLKQGGVPNAKKFDGSYSKEKHWHWRGGVTKDRVKIRTCAKYQNWRKAIFKRDDYTCHICGQRGGKLNIDHYPVMFAKIMKTNDCKTFKDAMACDELWNINNGRTLCEKCHKETPTYRKVG